MSTGISLAVGITVLALGTYAMRAAGPVLRNRISVSDGVEKLMDRATVVLLVAVALTGAFFIDHDFAGWARPAISSTTSCPGSAPGCRWCASAT